MEISNITRVGVVGAGTMGSGIAEIFAESGYEVIWYNRSEAGMQRGLARIRSNQQILMHHNILTPTDAEAVLARLYPTDDLEALSTVGLVSQSVAEDLALKRELWGKLDCLCHPEAILTTNTSGLSITSIAAALSNSTRFAGMHFANPPHLMPLVEIIKGDGTSDATCVVLLELARRLHKQPVLVRKDVPGFVANRLHVALLREALYLIEAGIASPAEIDTAVKNGLGLRWAFTGPVEFMDLAGLDLSQAIFGYLFSALSDTKEVPKVLQDLVAAGKLGAKSGAGFYDYPADKAQRIIDDRDDKLLKLLQLKSQSGD
jgi:3-hydroxybutyryl-CoA dehydrogenase